MEGVVQHRGEKTIVGTVLEHQRVAPVRTIASINGMISRCRNIVMKEGDSAELSIELEDDDENEDEDGYENYDYEENEDDDDEDDVKDEEE